MFSRVLRVSETRFIEILLFFPHKLSSNNNEKESAGAVKYWQGSICKYLSL